MSGENARSFAPEQTGGLSIEGPPREKVFEHVEKFGRDVGRKEHAYGAARNRPAAELRRGPLGRAAPEFSGVGKFRRASALSPPGVLLEVVAFRSHRHAVDVVARIVVACGKAEGIHKREAPRRGREDRAVRVFDAGVRGQGRLFGLRKIGDRVLGRSLKRVTERQIPKLRLKVAFVGEPRRFVLFGDARNRDRRAHRTLDGLLGKVRRRRASAALSLPDGDRQDLFPRVFESLDFPHSIGNAEAPVGAYFGRAFVGSERERTLERSLRNGLGFVRFGLVRLSLRHLHLPRLKAVIIRFSFRI